MPNKMKRSRTIDNPLKDTVEMPGSAGVFGANPAPGFREYPETPLQSIGNTKFQDTESSAGIGDARSNQLRRSKVTQTIPEQMGIQTPGTTTIIRGSNKMRGSRTSKTNNTGK